MKSQLSLLFLVSFLFACTTAKNISETPAADQSLKDKAVAVWEGTLPCPDCERIDYRLTLNSDNSFEEVSVFRGETLSETHENGRWQMNTDSIVILKQDQQVYKYFSLNNRQLEMMDLEGKLIDSVEHYRLQPVTLQDRDQLTGSKWRLIEMKGEKIQVSDTASIPTIEFDASTRRLMGKGGCNNYSGSFSLKANLVEIGPIVSTKMACPDMSIETSYFEMLSEKSMEHRIADNKLYLGEANQGLVFTRL